MDKIELIDPLPTLIAPYKNIVRKMINERFIKGDCIKIMKQEKNFNAQLILTDPPYNIGWNYSTTFKDKKKDYDLWCLEWAELCFKHLTDKGILAIINYPENNNKLYTELVKRGYNFVQELIWYYPTNVGHSKFKYTRNYRTIIIFSKSKKYFFNPKKQKYKNSNDKRIRKRIKKGYLPNHYTTFEYNLCKNVSKHKKKNGINQLPRELVKMLIETYTQYGDIVLDPFVGNGTVTKVAYDNYRIGIGIDIEEYETY